MILNKTLGRNLKQNLQLPSHRNSLTTSIMSNMPSPKAPEQWAFPMPDLFLTTSPLSKYLSSQVSELYLDLEGAVHARPFDTYNNYDIQFNYENREPTFGLG